MEDKVLSDLRKHMKPDIIKNDYINFDEPRNPDDIFITKHARKRAKQRGVNTKDVLLNKDKAGNIIVNNKVVNVLGCKGNGVSRIERQCDRCNHKYMSRYKGKKFKCKQCLDKENAEFKNAKLVNIELENAKLKNTKSVNTKLENAKLENAKLKNDLLDKIIELRKKNKSLNNQMIHLQQENTRLKNTIKQHDKKGNKKKGNKKKGK